VRISRWESINPAFSNISGFTQRTQAVNGSGKIDTFIKRMAGGESGTWTFAWTGSMWTTAQAMLYRGIDPAGLLSDNAIFKLVNATNSGANFPVVNAGSVGAGVLDWHGYSESGSPGHTSPTNWTETEDNDSDVNAWRAVTAGSYATTASAAGVSSPNIASLLFLPEAAGGASLTLGLVTESEFPPVVGREKIRIFGQPAESEVTPVLGRQKSANLGLPTESDLAPALSASKTRTLALIAESDLALSLTPSKVGALGLATESETVPSVSRSKSAAFELIGESEQVLVLVPAKTYGLGLLAESEHPLALSLVKSITLGLVIETEFVPELNLTGGVALVLGLITESETVFSLSATKSREVGLVVESELVPAVGADKRYGLGLVSESDRALAISIVKSLALGLASESEIVLELEIGDGGEDGSPLIEVTKDGTGIVIARIGVVHNGLFVEAVRWEVSGA
jgi:hypothetical protein